MSIFSVEFQYRCLCTLWRNYSFFTEESGGANLIQDSKLLSETKAMRNTIVATAVAPFLMIGLMAGFLGCKSAPKMPWSRTAATADVESAAIAHAAPALPADVAKQAESLAAAAPAINLTAPAIASTGGQAAPYSAAPAYTPAKMNLAATTPSLGSGSLGSGAKAAPAAYPSTGASPYSTTPTPKTPALPAQIAAAIPRNVPPAFRSTDKSANLGSVSMPYNPSAVPPAKRVAVAASVTPKVSSDRYGTSTVASNVTKSANSVANRIASTAPAFGRAAVPPVETASLPQVSGSSRYGRYGIGRNTTAATITSAAQAAKEKLAAASQAPTYNAPKATSLVTSPANVRGDRYAAITPTAPSVTQNTPMVTIPALPAQAITTPTAPAVAVASVYRPGGTTSYQGLAAGQAVAEIASRPKAPSTTTPVNTLVPSQGPRYR